MSILVPNHLYSTVDAGTRVLVVSRSEINGPANVEEGIILNHLDIPRTFGKSLHVRRDDGSSILADGGNHLIEVYI